MKKINKHFSTIAAIYRDVRTTDTKHIHYIKKKLEKKSHIKAMDVGCGAGRYDVQLFQHLGKKLFLYCVDANKAMLNQLKIFLKSYAITQFKTAQAVADNLPSISNSLDAIFTFNAVHHFDLKGFFKETTRTLKKNGYVFIYTRLRSQNKKSIWGKYFPFFDQKETRLYELAELKDMLKEFPELVLDTVKIFKYHRTAAPFQLIKQAKHKHYSTLYLYTAKEFSQALQEFETTLSKLTKKSNTVSWLDENILLVLRKA